MFYSSSYLCAVLLLIAVGEPRVGSQTCAGFTPCFFVREPSGLVDFLNFDSVGTPFTDISENVGNGYKQTQSKLLLHFFTVKNIRDFKIFRVVNVPYPTIVVTDKNDHIEKAYPTSNTTWVWWLLQGIYKTKQSHLVLDTKHLNAHFFLNPVKRDVLWPSLISQYQKSQNVCHETRPDKFGSNSHYTFVQKSQKILIALSLSE